MAEPAAVLIADRDLWRRRYEATYELWMRSMAKHDLQAACLAKVRELHRPLECVNAFCPVEQWCAGCDPEGDCCCSTHPWPCPTIQALDAPTEVGTAPTIQALGEADHG